MIFFIKEHLDSSSVISDQFNVQPGQFFPAVATFPVKQLKEVGALRGYFGPAMRSKKYMLLFTSFFALVN